MKCGKALQELTKGVQWAKARVEAEVSEKVQDKPRKSTPLGRTPRMYGWERPE